MSMGRMMASETRLVKRMGLRPHVIHANRIHKLKINLISDFEQET
jgi:hypothetical protein